MRSKREVRRGGRSTASSTAMHRHRSGSAPEKLKRRRQEIPDPGLNFDEHHVVHPVPFDVVSSPLAITWAPASPPPMADPPQSPPEEHLPGSNSSPHGSPNTFQGTDHHTLIHSDVHSFTPQGSDNGGGSDSVQSATESERVPHDEPYVGRVFDFSAEKINEFFGLANVDKEVAVDFDLIVRTLTGSKKTAWDRGETRFPVKLLTLKYAILHKMGRSNWFPTKHASGVLRDHALFLFSMVTGSPFDVGKMIMRTIMRHVGGGRTSDILPYPALIYNILQKQGLRKKRRDNVQELDELILTKKIFQGHTDDLLHSGSRRVPSGQSSVSSFLRHELQVTRSQIVYFESQIVQLRFKEKEILRLLSRPTSFTNHSLGDSDASSDSDIPLAAIFAKKGESSSRFNGNRSRGKSKRSDAAAI